MSVPAKALPAALAAFLLSAAVLSAPARAETGLYIAPVIGWSKPAEQDFTVQGIRGDLESDGGLFAGAALGFGLGSFRVEAELAYSQASLDQVTALGGTTSVEGDLTYWSGFLSGYFDIPVGPVVPYVGGGIGLIYGELEDARAAGFEFDDQDGGDLAFHGEAGVALDLGNFEIVPSYRYTWLDSGNADFGDTGIHAVRLGARFRL